MKVTNDPTEVFAQYSEGVTVHDDKTITITPAVQRDILDATAMLMHEHRKIFTVLTVVVGMLDTIDGINTNEVVDNLKSMLSSYFENPEGVALIETDSAEEVTDVMNQLQMLAMDEEVEN